MEKSVGADEDWERATDALHEALRNAGLPYTVAEGEGAFYGPKIDVHLKDAIGRRWQLSTLQVDFNHPIRFDLTYIGEDNERHRPIMIHRALFGSVERFFGILVEHYAGAFPTWLAPVQVQVLPVADRHDEYAARRGPTGCASAGFRAELTDATPRHARRPGAQGEDGEDPLPAGGGRLRRRRPDGGRERAGRRAPRARRLPRRLRRPPGRRGGGQVVAGS